MSKFFAAAALVLPLLAAPMLAETAFAETARLSSLDYKRANRCLAYANLQQLANDPIELGDLHARFAAAKLTAFPDDKVEAATDAREIRAAGRMADRPAEIERLKVRRDRACSFFTTGVTMAQK